MSTKSDSHLWQTSGPPDPVPTDLPCLSLEWSLRRDPLSEGPQRPEAGNSRWNTIAPLISFVFFDLARNLLLVRAHIGPRVCKIFSAQSGIRHQKIGLTCSKPPGLFEKPYRDPSAHNAGFTPAHIRAAFNPWECVPNVTHRPLEQLCFFSASQFVKQLFGLFQSAHRRRQGAACLTRMQAALS